jgi:hypothetical protein
MSPPENIPDEIAYEIQKSNNFATVYADGALGGPVPSGGIYMAFFIERALQPTRMVHQVQPDGKIGTAVRYEGTPGLCRELQMAVVMNISGARALQELLKNFIAQAEVIHAGLSKQG